MLTKRKIPFQIFIKCALLPVIFASCLPTPTINQTPLPTSVNYQKTFTDDFSNPASGWSRQRDENFIADYENGSYTIYIRNHSQSTLWGNLNRPIEGSVVVDVEVTKLEGGSKNDMGIICRFQDPQNYYYLSITANGAFGISKVINGTESLIGMADMPEIDDVILRENNTNHLRAECTDRLLILSVNNVELERVEDFDLTSGGVGLLVGTYTDPIIHVKFDNFSISQP